MEVDGVSAVSLYSHTQELIHLNSGSLGYLPTEIAELRNAFQAEIEREPDLWIRHKYIQHFDAAVDLLTTTYNSPPDQMTLVLNATTAISTVLTSLDLRAGDEILITDYTYGAVQMQCEEMAAKGGCKVRVLKIEFPFSHASILRQYEAELEAMEGARNVALIDHITSGGSLLMPLEAILNLCRQHKILTVVDGAHAPGQLTPVELDLGRLQPDFYAGNLHKWAFVPRGCALLYVAVPFLDTVRQQVVSWLHKKSFRYRFAFKGSFDTANIACIPASFRFAERLGGWAAIQAYTKTLLRQGMRHVLERLETELLCPEEYCAPFMMSFYLGQAFDDRKEIIKAMVARTFETRMYLYMREHVKVASSIVCVLNGRCVMRVSAHVFNTMDDFHRLADGLLKMRDHLQTMTLEDVEALPGPDW